MIIFFKGVEYDNVAVMDAEYNEGELIQFAGLMLRKIDNDLFQISKSLNIYLKIAEGKKINRFISRFTGITDSFLDKHGLERQEGIDQVIDFFSVEGGLAIVAHDIKNDNDMLYDNTIDIEELSEARLCTYKMAKQVFKREKNLKLEDIALEAGLQLSNGHNALDDAWATLASFSLLTKMMEEQEEEYEIL